MVLQGIVTIIIGIGFCVMAIVVANKDIKYDKKHNNTKYSEGLHTIEMFPALLVGLFMILFGIIVITG